MGKGTWVALPKILRDADIDLTSCYFSNVFMGLRESLPEDGLFPGADDLDFVRRCVSFLTDQLELIQPRVVVTLGKYAPRMLARVAPEVFANWQPDKPLKRHGFPGLGVIDALSASRVVSDVNGLLRGKATFVVLTHPAKRHLNLRLRRLAPVSEPANYEIATTLQHEAELQLLRSAVANLA